MILDKYAAIIGCREHCTWLSCLRTAHRTWHVTGSKTHIRFSDISSCFVPVQVLLHHQTQSNLLSLTFTFLSKDFAILLVGLSSSYTIGQVIVLIITEWSWEAYFLLTIIIMSVINASNSLLLLQTFKNYLLLSLLLLCYKNDPQSKIDQHQHQQN